MAICSIVQGQTFKKLPFDSLGVYFHELQCTPDGAVRIISSMGLWRMKGRHFDGPSISYERSKWRRQRDFAAEDSVRAIFQNQDFFFYVTKDNMILWTPSGVGGGWGIPPFNFPPVEGLIGNISRIWIDASNNLFIGTQRDNFFFIKDGANSKTWDYKTEFTKDNDIIVTKGAKPIKKIQIAKGLGVNAFAQDSLHSSIIILATTKGLYEFDIITSKVKPLKLDGVYDPFDITHILPQKNGDIWFSTLDKGMGLYNAKTRSFQFFPIPGKHKQNSPYRINTFCRKSANEFFVAIMDSLPAIFNTDNRQYRFFTDSLFQYSDNRTTDIDIDALGNLYIIKGGVFYYGKISSNKDLASNLAIDSSLLRPMIVRVRDGNGKEIASYQFNQEKLQKLKLPFYKNSFVIDFDVADLGERTDIHFAWKIDGYTYDWIYPYTFKIDSSFSAFIYDIKPGKYLFELKVKIGKEDWLRHQAELVIIITPPVWKQWWFWSIALFVVTILIFSIVKWRERAVRRHEREKSRYEKELLELEAQALRAQMNPHFIFNCMNSIKALIQNDQKQKSIDYLTTFSKLLRTLLNNSDKRQVSLYDELETSKLYTQLEAMRLDGKLQYRFDVDENLDLKSVMVPALIIQPFIENAIWHGIVPKENGKVWIKVAGNSREITCEIDDDGIGRELSKQIKPSTPVIHQSKGINLSQARLNIERILSDKNAYVEIVDKYENKRATGTKVIIVFKLQ
ncbi:MAG: histidine kinase [Chitinophagaceae bacterium]